MCRAFDEWMEDCRKEGEARGIKIGEERGRLRGEKRGEKERKKEESRRAKTSFTAYFNFGAEGRTADILRVAEDASLRNRLYRKYGL